MAYHGRESVGPSVLSIKALKRHVFELAGEASPMPSLERNSLISATIERRRQNSAVLRTTNSSLDSKFSVE
jgi:hypothetical protein